MKELYEPELLERQLVCGIVGGLLAMVVVPLAVVWLNSLSVLPEHPASLMVRNAVLDATGWPWQGLLALELGLAFVFGALVGAAVPPMEGTGRAVAVRTALHLAVSTAAYLGLCAVCGLWPGAWQGLLALVGAYWTIYGVVWLLRYFHWRAELRRIREGLGLADRRESRALRLRAMVPYLGLAAAVELGLPPLLRLLERGSDLPVLTGLLYPYLLLPFFGAATGWSVGRRRGAVLLYPVFCGLLVVPWIFVLYNASALFHVWMVTVPALAGVALGALVRWSRLRRREP